MTPAQFRCLQRQARRPDDLDPARGMLVIILLAGLAWAVLIAALVVTGCAPW